jgi:hypothetical protein
MTDPIANRPALFPLPLLLLVGLLLAAASVSSSAEQSAAGTPDAQAIHAMLDDFHQAAADADRERYLGHFAPGGVFMGTDDWERWPLGDFREYVARRFEGGTGWTYRPQDRHIAFAGDGETAWFDEIAVSPRWGRFRGTGVVQRTGDGWKIAHYSLTALVPNERFQEVSAINQAGFADRDAAQEGK